MNDDDDDKGGGGDDGGRPAAYANPEPNKNLVSFELPGDDLDDDGYFQRLTQRSSDWAGRSIRRNTNGPTILTSLCRTTTKAIGITWPASFTELARPSARSGKWRKRSSST
jgi:hypothetical protein